MKWIVVIGFLAAANRARADFNLAIGVKYLPVNYTKPVSVSGGGTGATTPLAGWNTTSIDNYVGLFILDGKLGFTLGLDLGYSSTSIQAGMANSNFSYTQFGLSLGAKYYLLKPTSQRVAPYVYFDFYKYVASVSTSATVPKGTEDFVGGLVSPLGIDAAVGAEYFFTPAFSLGAEILGLKYAYSSGSQPMPGFGAGSTLTQTNQYVTFYTGFTLNYRFGISGTLKAREAEESPSSEARPRHKPTELPPAEKPVEPPPPSEPPPQAPESVD